jgi:hypothetical protein
LQTESQQARQIAFARLIDERAPVAKGRGGLATLVCPQRIVVERGTGAPRAIARNIEQECENSFHDTYLLLDYGLPRRSDGTQQEYAAHREPVRSTTRSVVHGLTSPPFRCQTKKLSLLLAGRQLRNRCGVSRSFSPHCRVLALHDIESPTSHPEPGRRTSRIRFRLDSAGSGHPLGSLDLSGQRHLFVQTPHLTKESSTRLLG